MSYKSKINILLCCMCLFTMLTINGQVKFEKEYRIKDKEVPKKAKKFIDSSFNNQKIKWYTEESQDGKTIEAKTIYNKNQYSIEFDNLGNILDVEKKVKFKNLKGDLKKSINYQLNSVFKNYKILKTQIQWKASSKSLTALIKDEDISDSFETNYELVLKGQKKDTLGMFEVLFDSNGRILKIYEIIHRNTDNLQF